MSDKQAFLSYAREDSPRIERLYEGLCARGVNVWLDQKALEIGSWKAQIQKAIAQSDFFVIALSEAALRKTGDEPGFQDEELNTAYSIAREQAGKDFVIIPVRLEACGRGDRRVSGFQQFDLFEDWDGALDRLAPQIGGQSLGDGSSSEKLSDVKRQLIGHQSNAIALYYAGDYGAALQMWESIATLYGDTHDTWFGRGLNLDELGQLQQAIEAYEQALTFDPDNLGSLNNIGVSEAKLSHHQDAIIYFDSVVAEDPEYALALFNKGISLRDSGEFSEAVASLRSIAEIDVEAIERRRSEWGSFMETLKQYDNFRNFHEGQLFEIGPPMAA